MTIRPWIRKYNYINDYFWTIYQYYISVYPAYPVTYYQIDKNQTVWDDDKLYGGSYSKQGIGNLSGVKFKKVFMLPVFGIEQGSPKLDSNDEAGMSYYQSIPTRIVFPSIYGITPTEWDIVDLNFAFSTKAIKNKPMFSVTGINLAHQGPDYQLWEMRLQVAPFKLDDVEAQVSEYFMFVEHDKTIYPYSKAKLLLRLLERFDTLTDTRIKTIYNEKTGLYLQEEE